MGTIHKFQPKPDQDVLLCSSCGAQSTAACGCGVAYVPTSAQKREAIAEALTADAGRSDRQIAKTVGVSPTTVASVRASNVQFGHTERLEASGRRARGRKPQVSDTSKQMIALSNELFRDLASARDRFEQRLERWYAKHPSDAAKRSVSDALTLTADTYRKWARKLGRSIITGD